MTITPLNSNIKDAIAALYVYPAVIALPIQFRGAVFSGMGQARSSAASSIYAGKDPKIVSARYTTSRHRLDISIETSDNLLQIYRAAIACGPTSPKNAKTLRVKVMSIPRGFGKSEHPGIAVDTQGKQHRITQRKYEAYFKNSLMKRIKTVIMTNGFSDTVDCTKLNKAIAARISFSDLMASRYLNTIEKRQRACNRILGCLSSDPGRFNIQDIVLAGFLRGYPVLDVPYHAFHAYDTRIENKFIGLMQFGGSPNNTMNARTANKLSRVLGEPVDYKQLLSQLMLGDFRYASIGPDTRVYCLCVVNKTTKEAR